MMGVGQYDCYWPEGVSASSYKCLLLLGVSRDSRALHLIQMYLHDPKCFAHALYKHRVGIFTPGEVACFTTTKNKVWDVLFDQMSRKKGGIDPRIISDPSHLSESHFLESKTYFI